MYGLYILHATSKGPLSAMVCINVVETAVKGIYFVYFLFQLDES